MDKEKFMEVSKKIDDFLRSHQYTYQPPLEEQLALKEKFFTEIKPLTEKGPWQDEPNRLEFIHKGLNCLLQRNGFGVWCGYVGIPHTHPYYKKDYGDLEIEVHGGLTFGDLCSGIICHKGDELPLYWLGFDCAHVFDLQPFIPSMTLGYANFFEYRTMQYAKEQTEHLAEQLCQIS